MSTTRIAGAGLALALSIHPALGEDLDKEFLLGAIAAGDALDRFCEAGPMTRSRAAACDRWDRTAQIERLRQARIAYWVDAGAAAIRLEVSGGRMDASFAAALLCEHVEPTDSCGARATH